MDPQHFYTAFAAAFVRGKRPDLAHPDDGEAIARGLAAGLRLTRFKRLSELPRVRRVLGVLRGLGPERVVDIGSGRGAFLWPLLDALPQVAVTVVDRLAHRVADIHAVHRGGIERLSGARMDVRALALADDAACVVTLLEVLEHLTDPRAALAEVVRVARRAVVVSVPSREDDNPEHLHLFSAERMTALFRDAGAARVNIDYVHNHMVAVARVDTTG